MKTFIVVVLYLFAIVALIAGVRFLAIENDLAAALGIQLLISAALLAGLAIIVNVAGELSKRLDLDNYYRMADYGNALAMYELAKRAWDKYIHTPQYKINADMFALSSYEHWLKKAADAGHEEAQKEWESYCEKKNKSTQPATPSATEDSQA